MNESKQTSSLLDIYKDLNQETIKNKKGLTEYKKERINTYQETRDKDYYVYKDTWKKIAQLDLPFLPTPYERIEDLFNQLSKKKYLKEGMTLVDLGAGDGRIIIYSASKCRIKSIGVEIDKNLINEAYSKINELKIKDLCKIIEEDLYNFDVSTFDLIVCFILPTSHKSFKHVLESIKKNALIISIRWPLDRFTDDLIRLENIFYGAVKENPNEDKDIQEIEHENILEKAIDPNNFPIFLYRKI